MIKIKDNINLKDLKKFGFLEVVDNEFCMCLTIKEEFCVAIKNNRFLHVFYKGDRISEKAFQLWNMFLFDLIKADMVEVVEDE